MRILMGVDSEFAGETVRAVVAQCRPESTEVMVLHVLQPIGTAPPQMDAYFAPELEAEKEEADKLVKRTAKELQDAGFRLGSVSMAPPATSEIPPDNTASITVIPPQPSPASIIVVQTPTAGQRIIAGAVVNFEVR